MARPYAHWSRLVRIAPARLAPPYRQLGPPFPQKGAMGGVPVTRVQPARAAGVCGRALVAARRAAAAPATAPMPPPPPSDGAPGTQASTGGVGHATVPPEELQKLLDDFLKHGIAPRDGIALDPRRAEASSRPA